MTHKERVLKTFNLEKTDRVTIGYEANPGIHMKLAKALGISDGNRDLVLQVLGVDYRGVGAPYIGPMLFKTLPGRRTDPIDGYNMRWVEHASGGYWDFCDFPLETSHAIQDNTPVENVIAIYQSVYDYGFY